MKLWKIVAFSVLVVGASMEAQAITHNDAQDDARQMLRLSMARGTHILAIGEAGRKIREELKTKLQQEYPYDIPNSVHWLNPQKTDFSEEGEALPGDHQRHPHLSQFQAGGSLIEDLRILLDKGFMFSRIALDISCLTESNYEVFSLLQGLLVPEEGRVIIHTPDMGEEVRDEELLSPQTEAFRRALLRGNVVQALAEVGGRVNSPFVVSCLTSYFSRFFSRIERLRENSGFDLVGLYEAPRPALLSDTLSQDLDSEVIQEILEGRKSAGFNDVSLVVGLSLNHTKLERGFEDSVVTLNSLYSLRAFQGVTFDAIFLPATHLIESDQEINLRGLLKPGGSIKVVLPSQLDVALSGLPEGFTRLLPPEDPSSDSMTFEGRGRDGNCTPAVEPFLETDPLTIGRARELLGAEVSLSIQGSGYRRIPAAQRALENKLRELLGEEEMFSLYLESVHTLTRGFTITKEETDGSIFMVLTPEGGEEEEAVPYAGNRRGFTSHSYPPVEEDQYSEGGEYSGGAREDEHDEHEEGSAGGAGFEEEAEQRESEVVRQYEHVALLSTSSDLYLRLGISGFDPESIYPNGLVALDNEPLVRTVIEVTAEGKLLLSGPVLEDAPHVVRVLRSNLDAFEQRPSGPVDFSGGWIHGHSAAPVSVSEEGEETYRFFVRKTEGNARAYQKGNFFRLGDLAAAQVEEIKEEGPFYHVDYKGPSLREADSRLYCASHKIQMYGIEPEYGTIELYLVGAPNSPLPQAGQKLYWSPGPQSHYSEHIVEVDPSEGCVIVRISNTLPYDRAHEYQQFFEGALASFGFNEERDQPVNWNKGWVHGWEIPNAEGQSSKFFVPNTEVNRNAYIKDQWIELVGREVEFIDGPSDSRNPQGQIKDLRIVDDWLHVIVDPMDIRSIMPEARQEGGDQ